MLITPPSAAHKDHDNSVATDTLITSRHNFLGGEGVDGVNVYAPDGTKLGQIHVPESCANLCFVGERRSRLSICGSQSVYTLHTAAEGAPIT